MKFDVNLWDNWRIDAAGAGSCILLTLLFYFAAILPLIDRHRLAEVQQSELRDKLASVSKGDSLLLSLNSRLQSAKLALDESPLLLQDASSANKRLAEISKLAAECNLKINEIQCGSYVSTSHYLAVPIQLNGSGTYQTCTLFLNRMKKGFTDISVVSMNMTAVQDGRTAGSNMQLELKWYALPEFASSQK